MKKLLAILLCLLLLCSAVPLSVFAKYENDSNLETVTGSVNRDRFEKLGTGFNALSDAEITDDTIKPYSVLNYDGAEALLLGTSSTRAEATYATSAEELMLAFGISYSNNTDVTFPVKVATVGIGTKFGISADLKYQSITESMYYYYTQETVSNKLSLYLPEKKMDNPEEIISEDFYYALEKLAADASDENIATFYNTWGTHILVSYNKGAMLEYVASSHIHEMDASLNAALSAELSASVGVGKVSVKNVQEFAANISAEYKNKEFNLSHKWYAYGGDSNLVNGSKADAGTEEMSESIDEWSRSIGTGGQYNTALLPKSTQWKAIWEFIPNEFADLKASLQNYYQAKAVGVNAAFFEKFTTYGVTGATKTYYTSVAKDATGNNLMFQMPTRDNFAVAPGSQVNIVNVGTDLSSYEAVVTPAGYATVSNNGVVTFSASAQGGSEVTIQLKERRRDGTVGSVRLTANYTIQAEGADGKFAGGYGEEARPYLISDATHFSNIRSFSDKQFRLINDISLGSMATIPTLSGVLDGNGYTVRDWLYSIPATGKYGLFQIVDETAVVKNLNVTNVVLYCPTSYSGDMFAGTICGENLGVIENVHITQSTIYLTMKSGGSSSANGGGICGQNRGVIRKSGVSYCNGEHRIEGRTYVSDRNAQSAVRVGGLVGWTMSGSKLEDVYSHDNRIIGRPEATTSYVSYNKAYVYNRVGGIVGTTDAEATEPVEISHALAYANDTSESKATGGGDARRENEIGTLIGQAKIVKITNAYTHSGEGKQFGEDSKTSDSMTYQVVSLTTNGIVNQLNGFNRADSSWYQPAGGGHITIAQPVSLSINSAYLNTEYFVGEALNYGGIEIKPVQEGFTDPLDTLLNGFTISGYDPSKVGTQTITVTYGKVKDTYTVTVKEPEVTSLSIITLPDRTMFYEGEEIDYTGLSVLAVKSDGSSVKVALSDLEYANDGETVIVTYAGCTVEFMIQICPVVATNMEIITLADKIVFAVGEDFSASGLSLQLIYNNGTKQTLTAQDVEIVTPDMSSYGTKIVTVTYSEFVCTYEIVIEGCLHKRQRTVPAEFSTCSVQGHGEYTECMDCGEVIKGSKELLPLLSHVYDDAYDADCNLCGEKREVTPNLPEDAPTFVMDNVSAAAGDTFTMAIRTERNSGIVSFKLNLTYDPDVLELISVEEKDFIGMSFSPMGNPFIINWVDALRPNNTTNGVVLLVTFRVKEDAPAGVSDITLSYDPEDVYDQNFDNVAFRIENGSVKVVDYIPGDVNSDGKVNNKDLGRLQQYVNGWDVSINASAADVNGDGKVNNKDLGRLQQYVNGWDVELG